MGSGNLVCQFAFKWAFFTHHALPFTSITITNSDKVTSLRSPIRFTFRHFEANFNLAPSPSPALLLSISRCDYLTKYVSAWLCNTPFALLAVEVLTECSKQLERTLKPAIERILLESSANRFSISFVSGQS